MQPAYAGTPHGIDVFLSEVSLTISSIGFDKTIFALKNARGENPCMNEDIIFLLDSVSTELNIPKTDILKRRLDSRKEKNAFGLVVFYAHKTFSYSFSKLGASLKKSKAAVYNSFLEFTPQLKSKTSSVSESKKKLDTTIEQYVTQKKRIKKLK